MTKAALLKFFTLDERFGGKEGLLKIVHCEIILGLLKSGKISTEFLYAFQVVSPNVNFFITIVNELKSGERH